MIKRSQNKWIAHQRISDKGEINLLCFVFAGGSPSFFAQWKNIFPEWVNFIPVLYPQREKRASENMPESVEELIASFLTDNKHLTDKPYVIWGHCSGALIGMEIAVADISNGNRPDGFIISVKHRSMHCKDYNLEMKTFLKSLMRVFLEILYILI